MTLQIMAWGTGYRDMRTFTLNDPSSGERQSINLLLSDIPELIEYLTEWMED